ncbi:MAG: SH3 domain-containing protein [Anaerolineales bacterium]
MSETLPPSGLPPSRARRRRARRMLLPSDPQGREAVLLTLSRRAYPTVEFFLLSFLSGAILTAGYLLDSPLLLVFGALSAPVMLPWLGLILAGARGAFGFWVQMAAALLLSAALAFVSGLIAGGLLRVLPPRTLTQAYFHARLWPVDFVILALGVIILVLSFVRSDEKPYLPSALLAYTFYLPIVAAAIGLGGGIEAFWPHGLFVALVRLAWASLLGTLLFYLLRFRPASLMGVLFSGGLLFGWLSILAWAGGAWPKERSIPAQASLPTPSPQVTLSPTPIAAVTPTPLRAISPTPSPLPSPSPAPSATSIPLTPTEPLPSETPTVTITAVPTPIYARVNSPRGGGAYLRAEPSFNARVLISLSNGAVVEVFPQDARLVGNDTWLRVVAIVGGRRFEGWMLSTVIQMPTPMPTWWLTPSPSATLTLTITLTP